MKSKYKTCTKRRSRLLLKQMEYSLDSSEKEELGELNEYIRDYEIKLMKPSFDKMDAYIEGQRKLVNNIHELRKLIKED